MSSQTLYRKWRPQTFAEVRGQDRVIRTLQNALAAGRIGHAYLFCGPRGVGKTTTARLLAKAVNCLHDGAAHHPGEPFPIEPDNTCSICRQIAEGRCLDVIEIDAASSGRVDDARDLRDQINFAPNEARYKFYIIDEAHQITKDAFDALLKTFEEPPEHVMFVLATTDPNKVPPTILSRCQRFDFRRLSAADIRASLVDICASEGVPAEAAALEIIARAAEGSSRDSLSVLDQAIAFCGGQITVSCVRTMLGMASADSIQRLAAALLDQDARAGLQIVNEATNAGVDPRGLNRELVEYLRNLLLLKVSAAAEDTIDLPAEDMAALKEQAPKTTTERLIRQIKLFADADYAFRSALQAQLPLELAFLQAAQMDGERPASAERVAGPSDRVAAPSPVREAQAPPAAGQAPMRVIKEAPAREAHESSASVAPAAAPTSDGRHPEHPPELPATDPEVVSVGQSQADIAFQDIVDSWPRVLEMVRGQAKNVEALLRSCTPTALDGAVVILQCDAPFHAKTIEQPDKKRMIEGAISRVAGRPCYVKCVVREKKAHAAEPSGGSRPPEDDPLVRAALRMLNARILE